MGIQLSGINIPILCTALLIAIALLAAIAALIAVTAKKTERNRDLESGRHETNQSKPRDNMQRKYVEELVSCRRQLAKLQQNSKCGQRFLAMSIGLQEIFAIADQTKEGRICDRVEMALDNGNVLTELSKASQTVTEDSLEEENLLQYSPEVLCCELEEVKRQCKQLAMQPPWDRIMTEMTPALQRLKADAEERKEEPCHEGIIKLKKILARHQITVTYFYETVVQENEKLRLDFTDASGLSLPVFYATDGSGYVRVSSLGVRGDWHWEESDG